MVHCKFVPAFACLALLLQTAPLSAAGSADKPHVRVTLHAEDASLRPGQRAWLAMRFDIDPGWHIYWLNPGDSGAPPKAAWRLPAGLSAGPFEWPAPRRLDAPPLTSYALEGEAALLAPLAVAAAYPGKRAELAADVDWLECRELCLPGSARVALSLPVSGLPARPDPAQAELFARARFRLPLESSGWTARAYASGEKVRLELEPPPEDAAGPADIEFFPEDARLIERITEKSATLRGRLLVYEYDRSTLGGEAPAELRGVLVRESGWRGPASERGLRLAAPLRPMYAGARLWAALLLAFLGGLILNLMPCVLPVVALKVMGFVRQAQDGAAGMRRQGLLFAAGILVSFWALAGLLAALRAGGQQLGWGFQLQSPPFVAFLALLFFVLGLSMTGVFEIGASLTRLGGIASQTGPAGAFLNGMLAAVVATPCTAPFMGTALGFALTQGAAAGLAVFTALGLGMASPYLALSFAPGLQGRLPRPGPWMETLKQVMGFLLLATTVWLLWVLGRQAGADAMALALASLLPAAFGAWTLGRWAGPEREPAARRLALAAGLLIIGGAAAFAVAGAGRFATVPRTQTAAAGSIAWLPYSEELLAGLKREKRIVFLDFTAAWCLTCQVNERTALAADSVRARFAELDIAAVKADWTSRDAAITSALQSYGRSGVPLYVLHAPGREPRLLPAILTPAAVLKALDGIAVNEGKEGI